MNDGILRVSRERRRASTVTLITGADERECADLAKTLKKLCGSGGTAKNGIVEIQGDHRDTIVAYLQGQKRRVKRAGG